MLDNINVTGKGEMSVLSFFAFIGPTVSTVSEQDSLKRRERKQ